MTTEKITKTLNRFSIIIVAVAICIGIYIAANGIGLIPGLNFGPGSYYYTDIPNWQNIFLGQNSINLGVSHTWMAFAFFFAWGFICFKALQWLDQKIK